MKTKWKISGLAFILMMVLAASWLRAGVEDVTWKRVVDYVSTLNSDNSTVQGTRLGGTGQDSSAWTGHVKVSDGNWTVFNPRSYIIWTNPSRCDEGNATIQGTPSSDTYGLCKYSASADYRNNYAIYRLPIPPYIDTTQDFKVEQFGIRLDNTDTGAHCYKIEAAVVAPSSAFGPATFSSTVNIPIAADGSGASGDFESATNITLMGWKSISGIGTAGNRLVIKIGRDGGNEGTNCASGAGSTVASYGAGLIISYGSSQ